MNEQFIFYWLSWLIVIIIYFFMDKSRMKYFLLFTMFLSIILINEYVMISPYMTISLSFFVILVAALILYVHYSFHLYELFVTLMLIITYVALLIWAKVAPIWFVMHPFIMIPTIIFVLIVMMNDDLMKQIVIVTISLAVGHVLYGMILFQYQLQSRINETFFIYLFISILLLFISHLLTLIVQFIKRTIANFRL